MSRCSDHLADIATTAACWLCESRRRHRRPVCAWCLARVVTAPVVQESVGEEIAEDIAEDAAGDTAHALVVQLQLPRISGRLDRGCRWPAG